MACRDGVLCGLASFGLGCGTVPGVYTEVQHFLDWIQDNTY